MNFSLLIFNRLLSFQLLFHHLLKKSIEPFISHFLLSWTFLERFLIKWSETYIKSLEIVPENFEANVEILRSQFGVKTGPYLVSQGLLSKLHGIHDFVNFDCKSCIFERASFNREDVLEQNLKICSSVLRDLISKVLDDDQIFLKVVITGLNYFWTLL